MIAVSNADRDKIAALLRAFSRQRATSTKEANDQRMASLLARKLERKKPFNPTKH